MENINSIYIIIFLLCLVLSGIFSGTETAFISLPKLRVKHLASTGDKKAQRLEKILTKPSSFLAAILLSNNLVNVAAASLGTIIAVSLIGEPWAAVIATVGVTTLVLIFGEVIPKTFATHHAERIALIFSRPMEILIGGLYPFVWILDRIGLGFIKMVTEAEPNQNVVKEEEIHHAITVGEEEGVWEETEAEMLRKAFEFTDRPVREIMTPRTEITFLARGMELSEFFDIYRTSPFSRFPVYQGNPDNVTGLLYIKDVLMAQANNSLDIHGSIDDLVRPAYFVPESKHLGDVLAEMRDSKYGMVVIVDEFGGVAGMVTSEQIIEEIVGSLGDELGNEVEDIINIDANTYEIDGGLRVEEANEELDLDLPSGDYETMAGFVLSHLGRIPKQGEQFRFRDLKLGILEMRGMKIERILVIKEVDATPAS
jgi:putative hemolysin